MHNLLILENSKIKLKHRLKLFLHVSVHDQHQGAYTWAWLKLQSVKLRRYVTSARLKYKLPDDGREPKHVGAISI
jgi:hypothetical protein